MEFLSIIDINLISKVFGLIFIVLFIVSLTSNIGMKKKLDVELEYTNFLMDQGHGNLSILSYKGKEKRELFLQFLACVSNSVYGDPGENIKKQLKKSGYYKDIREMLLSNDLNKIMKSIRIIKDFNLHTFSNLLIGLIEKDRLLLNSMVLRALCSFRRRDKRSFLISLLFENKIKNYSNARLHLYKALIKEFYFSKYQLESFDPFYSHEHYIHILLNNDELNYDFKGSAT